MKFSIFVFFLIASSSALHCPNYAQAIGNMSAVDSVAWRAALRSVNGILGVERNQTCSPGEKCVNDVYYYADNNGERAGLVWTSCGPSEYTAVSVRGSGKAELLQNTGQCYWNEMNDAVNGFTEIQYRCVCDFDGCTVGNGVDHMVYNRVFGSIV